MESMMENERNERRCEERREEGHKVSLGRSHDGKVECKTEGKIEIEGLMSDCNFLHHCDQVMSRVEDSLIEVKQRMTREKGRKVIFHIQGRIKKADSIIKKLERKNYDINIESALSNLNDICGLRVICLYQDEIYEIVDEIQRIPGLKLLKKKDYVLNPKRSGYRGYHLIVSFGDDSENSEEIHKVEIQIRTQTMDFWAVLDHSLKYKSNFPREQVPAEELLFISEKISEIDRDIMRLRNKLIRRNPE